MLAVAFSVDTGPEFFLCFMRSDNRYDYGSGSHQSKEAQSTAMKGIVKVMSGICGMFSEVRATSDMQGGTVNLEINTRCENIQKLADEIKVVDPFEEISFQGKGPKTLRLAAKHCKHTACPVPAGIIKAIEVASGLALPKDAVIEVRKED
jgi:hypothetical protein